MKMRIIGGEYRSRLIAMPKGVLIRPTQDKVRESIFNILRNVSGKRILELFAGSGALGIEAISRGASHATFIDNNSKCVEAIMANLESLSIDSRQYDIIRADALSALPRLKREGKKFDLVFVDPPYHERMAEKCLMEMDYYDILSRVGLVVVEHSKKDDLPLNLKTVRMHKARRYGDTVITIFC